jgi:glycosyltransferase involved in cell wall biosynthesis
MTSPRQVVFIGIDTDSMGGSQRVIHTIAHGLAERGHHVCVIGIRPAETPMTYYPSRAYQCCSLFRHIQRPPGEHTTTSRVLLEGLFGRPVSRYRSARAHARAERLLRSCTGGYLVLGSPWAADWILPHTWQHLRAVGWYHESFDQARTSANLELIKKHYPRLDRSLFLTDEDTAQFQDHGVLNALTMPNPVPFYPAAAAPLICKRVIGVGRFTPVKAFQRLISAFSAAVKLPGTDGDRWELHLVGDGPERDALISCAAEHGITQQVIFPGRSLDMDHVYQQASILALSSEHEGSSMAVAEAAACGLPAVAYDVSPGVRNLIAHQQTGLLVPPRNIHAMARALARLMQDHDLRRQMGGGPPLPWTVTTLGSLGTGGNPDGDEVPEVRRRI